MKIMKTILFTITMIVGAQACAMEAPPAPPAVNAPQITLEKPRLAFAKQLPGDLQRYLFTLCMEGNLSETTETILAIAGINKESQKYVNENMIAILETFPYTEKRINLLELLQNKKTSLPVMQMPHMKAWLENTKKSLYDGSQLSGAIKNGTLQQVCEILKNKNISLSYCLFLAASLRKKEQILLLLEAGASPKSILSPYYEKEIAAILLKWGASPNIELGEYRRREVHGPIPMLLPDKYHLFGSPETRQLIIEAQELQKKRLEDRKKRIYTIKVESKQLNTADGCVLS